MSITADQTVFLVGFSGSGKSTVGTSLAHRLNRTFVDTDSVIEQTEGCSIAEIFRCSGEWRFRQLEADVIAGLGGRRQPAQVVALGGGAFASRANRTEIMSNGLVVYLSCSVREIYRRLRDKEDRPLMNVQSKVGETARQARLRIIRTLLEKRKPGYRLAHMSCSTTGKTVEQVVNEIMWRIRNNNA